MPITTNGFSLRARAHAAHFARVGDRSPIPDRHSEDLFVGVRAEGFERQSALVYRTSFANQSNSPAFSATLPMSRNPARRATEDDAWFAGSTRIRA